MKMATITGKNYSNFYTNVATLKIKVYVNVHFEYFCKLASDNKRFDDHYNTGGFAWISTIMRHYTRRNTVLKW